MSITNPSTRNTCLHLFCVIVLSTEVLSTTTTAQDLPDTLHPPPFLEATDLFGTFRWAPRGIVLDEATVFDADIYPHFVLFGASSCRGTSRPSSSSQPCISITPAIRLRMENKDSAPINSPSFVPRVNFQWLFYDDRGTTRSFGLHAGHHSNGQAGHLFQWEDTGENVPSEHNRSLVDYLGKGSIIPDTEEGNFSVNYLKASFDYARYDETDRAIDGHHLAVSVEWFPDQWLYAPLRNEVYPALWLRGGFGIASANAPLCRRSELLLKATAYEYVRELAASGSVEWGCISSPERGLGFFLRYSYGRDEYNSSFFIDPAHRIQFGLTVNRRRTFGGDY